MTATLAQDSAAERLAALRKALPTVEAEDLRDGLAHFLTHLADADSYGAGDAHAVVSFLVGWLLLDES